MPVISLLHPSLDVRTLGTEASLNRYDTLVVPEMVEVGIEPDFDMWAETTVFVDLGSNANLTTPYWIAAAEVGTANYPAQVTWELGILDDIVQATRTDPSQRLGGNRALNLRQLRFFGVVWLP